MAARIVPDVIDTDAEEAIGFLKRLGPGDRLARFGSASAASVDWLGGKLANDPAHHSALGARVDGELVALLDICDGDELEFGLVVGSGQRRRGLGRTLVDTLVARAHRASGPRTLVANCERSNAAALALVRACGFERTSAIGGGLVRYERVV